MAKKKKKIDILLKRAEKLFKAGNFLSAEKKFEQIQNKLDTNKIAKKLEICREKTRSIKGKKFVEQGHNAVKKNNLPEAIVCFQEAYKFLKEPWLSDKINEMQYQLTGHKIGVEAIEAEISGEYIVAADLYARAWKKNNHQGFILKGAVCHIKAENYLKAVALFDKSDLSDDTALYYYGFALAKIGKYYDALKLWKKIDTLDSQFIEQKQIVFSLACSRLGNTFNKEEDINGVHHKANDLLGIATAIGDTKLIVMLETICTYSKLVLIETLWEQKQFVAIANLLSQMVQFNDSFILALNAKTYFHLSRESSDFLESMMTYWLTAIYSNEIAEGFSDNEDKRKKAQYQLIRCAEEQINRHRDSRSARHAASYLTIEKKLLKDISAVSLKHNQGFHQTCTPHYASIFGLSDTILDLIKHNKNKFKDPEHYLETGGYYSKAGESLYALKTGDTKKALSLIKPIESSSKKNEFTDYVVRLVQFEFGRTALKNNEKEYLQYFTLTPKLFESVPAIEKRFINKILQRYNEKQLIAYDKLLTLLHKKRPSDLICEAYSCMMIQLAISKYNQRKIKNKQLKVVAAKALKIYPNNAFARHILNKTTIFLESEMIHNAMDKNKFMKAARLARQSAYPEVCDNFFEFMEDLIEHLNLSDLEPAEQKMFLHDLYRACMDVDPYHLVIDLINEELKLLED